MAPQDFIDEIYLALLEQGWSLNDIDTMDILYYLRLLKRKMTSKQIYIDEIF
ncbi:hypothetical protein [Alkalihalobacterium bogoriense]|uniref:hypothetical protein n=1 Tax=Alkalihalobacterium bogoriense TaxID=246272 RepID=UPI000AA3ACC1|nr:hypothetical protein [Alkalihalobacterium bogoriense]